MTQNAEKPPSTQKISLQADHKYSFCSCGKSKKLPFCDDTHKIINAEKGTSYKPIKIWPTNDITVEVYCGNWESVNEK